MSSSLSLKMFQAWAASSASLSRLLKKKERTLITGSNGATKRFSPGFKAGLWATGGMTVIMLIGTVTGVAPMPKPIPIALAKLVLES